MDGLTIPILRYALHQLTPIAASLLVRKSKAEQAREGHEFTRAKTIEFKPGALAPEVSFSRHIREERLTTMCRNQRIPQRTLHQPSP